MSNPNIWEFAVEDQRSIYDAAGSGLELPARMVEKDFWVCWTLRHLFSLPGARKHFIFKGGTSLSKVWRVVHRFSEDIGSAYVRPTVRIECGARSDRWPVAEGAVTPYVAEAFPDAFPDATAKLPVLGIERTFWEKASILHAEFHRPHVKATSSNSNSFSPVSGTWNFFPEPTCNISFLTRPILSREPKARKPLA